MMVRRVMTIAEIAATPAGKRERALSFQERNRRVLAAYERATKAEQIESARHEVALKAIQARLTKDKEAARTAAHEREERFFSRKLGETAPQGKG